MIQYNIYVVFDIVFCLINISTHHQKPVQQHFYSMYMVSILSLLCKKQTKNNNNLLNL